MNKEDYAATLCTILENMDWVSENGCTTLESCLVNIKQREVLKHLIIHKRIQLDGRGQHGGTLLMYAIKAGARELFMFLIQHYGGEIVHLSDSDNVSPLLIAVKHDAPEFARVLLEKGADPHFCSFYNETPMSLTIKKRNLDILRLMVRHPTTDLNMVDGDAYTPLTLAIKNGYHDVVHELLAANVDIQQEDDHQKTPLMYAIEDVEIVRTLIKNGADVYHQGPNGETALMLAAREGNLGVVQVLLAKGGRDYMSIRDNQGASALYYAMHLHNCDVVEFLLQKGDDIDRKHHGKTALIHAACWNDTKLTTLLLQHGANVDIRDDQNGRTALEYAKKNCHSILRDAIKEFDRTQALIRARWQCERHQTVKSSNTRVTRNMSQRMKKTLALKRQSENDILHSVAHHVCNDMKSEIFIELRTMMTQNWMKKRFEKLT